MDYTGLINNAIKNHEVLQLLRGEKEYEVVVSEFSPDIFPTDINTILVRCFYKQMEMIEGIDKIFMMNMEKLLSGNACDVYIAILYFDACLFHEKRGAATFEIEKESLMDKIQAALCEHRQKLQDEVVFSNGMKKRNPWRNIENFNKDYLKNYGFSIVD